MVLDTFRKINDVNSKCSFISSLSVAEFVIIAKKPDVSGLLDSIPFPMAGFSFQKPTSATGADTVVCADDRTDSGRDVTQHSSPGTASDSADQQSACVQFWSEVERLILKARENKARCQ